MKSILSTLPALALGTALAFGLPLVASAKDDAPHDHMKGHDHKDGHKHMEGGHKSGEHKEGEHARGSHKGHEKHMKHEGHKDGDKHHGGGHEAKGEHAMHHPKAAHGGVVLEIEGHHAELVAKEGKITLYISDHDGHAAPAKGFSATAMVLGAQGRQGPIKLSAMGDNKLESTKAVKTTPGSRIIITLKDPHGHMSQARYQMP